VFIVIDETHKCTVQEKCRIRVC